MAPSSLTFVGGLLMGLASSLHCAGMCGAIASSLLFTFDPGGGWARARVHFTGQFGRILVYITGGSLLGGLGAAFYGAFDQALGFAAMRAAAAIALSWIGLSLAGFAPSLAGVDRFTAPLSVGLNALRAATGGGASGIFFSGMVWGLLPCGMVYGALFYAMLAGSALGGAEVMAGFGLGTLPSVTAVALGLTGFRRMAATPKARVAVGLALIGVAVLSVAIPAVGAGVICWPK